MSLNPPPRWKLYRYRVEIDGQLYGIPPLWCVLVCPGKTKVVGPEKDDNISFRSALQVDLLDYRGAGHFAPVGHVQTHWFWRPDKGLLTEEEIQAGETGEGLVYV